MKPKPYQSKSLPAAQRRVRELTKAHDTTARLLDAYAITLRRVFERCNVTYYPPMKDGLQPYPLEHNPHAKKDMKDAILAALRQLDQPLKEVSV